MQERDIEILPRRAVEPNISIFTLKSGVTNVVPVGTHAPFRAYPVALETFSYKFKKLLFNAIQHFKDLNTIVSVLVNTACFKTYIYDIIWSKFYN